MIVGNEVYTNSNTGILGYSSGAVISDNDVYAGPFGVEDAAYFEGCMMLSSGTAVYTCLNDGFDAQCSGSP